MLTNFFASSLPFILAHAMAKPLSSLLQILSRPQHKEEAFKSIGLKQICRPFVGFFLFCVGKLLITIFIIGMYEMATPGFVGKPFTTYNIIAILMLSPLGLHFFLAYQEFAFYSFCSIYGTFAKRVLETSELDPKLISTSPIQPGTAAEQKNIVVYDVPRETLHGNLKELIDLMKNMTETFGPFLFQNFSLMLLYWLLHSYTLCFFVIQTIRNPLFDPTYLALIFAQFAGSLLIVR